VNKEEFVEILHRLQDAATELPPDRQFMLTVSPKLGAAFCKYAPTIREGDRIMILTPWRKVAISVSKTLTGTSFVYKTTT
jgi:hypothetical protein